MGPWNWKFAILLAACCCLFVSAATGQENSKSQDGSEEPKSEEPRVNWLKTKVQVVDPDGNPIQDAVVFCTGLRSRQSPGSHFFFSEERFGKAARIKTNADGFAELPYPEFIDNQKELATSVMTWSVEHPGFVAFREDRAVEGEIEPLSLVRGYRIAATATLDGQRVMEGLYGIVGNEYGKWELKSNGMLISPTMATKNNVCRLVGVRDGRPPVFSDWLELESEGKSRVLLKDVELKPGVRVEGKLGANVPRPIQNGRVVYWVVKPGGDGGQFRWSWTGHAKIDADGTFVLESVPGDASLQLIALCDGWLSQPPEQGEVAVHFPGRAAGYDPKSNLTHPRLEFLTGSKVEMMVPMEDTEEVQVRVLGPDGRPVENATVAMAPNQKWFTVGTQIVGDAGSSIDGLLGKQREAGRRGHRFWKQTNQQGRCVFKNVPKRVIESVVVWSDGLRADELPVRLDEGPQSVTIRMYEPGKKPLWQNFIVPRWTFEMIKWLLPREK